ncbi:MAG: hypothetical protein LBQ11_02125 [Candidatus Nomurabacteria bacterium]|nr:hypothetical protein [Candidatus Nomurabacteria bacterium]
MSKKSTHESQIATNELPIIGSVEDFHREGPLDYPGKRPERSYITDGDKIYGLEGVGVELIEQIDEYLKNHNLPLMCDRIPVLAYGANASPGSLRTKFSKYDLTGTEVSDKEAQTTPVIFSSLSDMDVVWNGVPGLAGNHFAELYKGPETVGCKVQVAVQFLTHEQMAIMHTTEGITYEFADIGQVDLGNDLVLDQVISYVARQSNILLDNNGQPISVAGIKRENSALQELDVREAMNYTLGNEGVRQVIGEKTPDEYVTDGGQMDLSGRKARKAEVLAAMQKSGISRDMQYPVEYKKVYTTGGLTVLPHLGKTGYPLKNDDGSEVIGYVEFGELNRLRKSPEERKALKSQLRTEHPDWTPEQVAEEVDPILYQLGELALAAARYYIPEYRQEI